MNPLERLEHLQKIVEDALPGLDLTAEQKQAVRERAAQRKTPKKKKYWWALAMPVVTAAIVCAVVVPVSQRSLREVAGSMAPIDVTDLMTEISPSQPLAEQGEVLFGSVPAAGSSQELDMAASQKGSHMETAQDQTGFEQATMEFSLGLLRESLKPTENTLISPASAALVLGMTANGTSGNTLTQFLDVLGQGELSLEQMNQSYLDWRQRLESDEEQAVLTIANSIWFAKGFSVKETFLHTNAEYFDAGAYQLDFSQTSAVQRMNACVSEHTKGKISSLMDEVDPAAQMYLINAVFLKMNWQTPFSESTTKPMEFHSADGTVATVDFMYGVDHYLQNDRAQGIKKAYRNSNYQFVAVLPKEGISLTEYLSTLTAGEFLDLVGQEQGVAEYELPKFKVEGEHRLNEPLQAMGLTEVFGASADFSSLSSEADGLYLDEVVQKAVFSIDETGTEAAAGTYAGISRMSMPVATCRLTFDRPFLFAVLDESGLPVFLGTVENPNP